MPSPRNQSRKAIAADREKRAMALRLAGATYEQIASELHISLGAAHKAVQSVLDRTRQQCSEQADELRQLEVARLDRMLLLLESQIRTGHLGAIDRALRIQERRAKLLGLDAPVRQETTLANKDMEAYLLGFFNEGSDSNKPADTGEKNQS